MDRVQLHSDPGCALTFIHALIRLKMMQCFLLCFGQLLLIFKRKWVYLSAVVVFEIGSLLCGVAPEVNTLILGRAFAGVGAAGIVSIPLF